MAVEFQGCRRVVIAEVGFDNADGITYGEVKRLAPVGQISKTVETASEVKYYDNVAQLVANSEGGDTVTFTVAIPTDEILALITGRVYDETKKAFIETIRVNREFAVGYILGEIGEGDDERFVWRYKGTFQIPDENSITKSNSTESSNMSLIFTGIFTTHEFTNGGGTGVKAPAKAMFVRKSNGYDEETYFAQVTTPDTESGVTA